MQMQGHIQAPSSADIYSLARRLDSTLGPRVEHRRLRAVTLLLPKQCDIE